MKEIGSEFWEVPIIEMENNLFPNNTQWFLSGRSALYAIIKELKDCHTVALPSWCCNSMIKPFIDSGFEVRLYPVYWCNGLVQEIYLDSDVLFLINYFGYTTAAPDLRNYNGIIIRDVTHSIFSADYSDANYYFGSLRKWCGLWTGGFAWTDDGHKLSESDLSDYDYVKFRQQAMQLKDNYIRGMITDKKYLEVFKEAEEILENIGIVPATARDIKLALRLDVRKIISQRRINAEVLRMAFSDRLIFPNLQSTDCPLFVPILVQRGKRDELRSFMIKNGIYCPIHWPLGEYHKLEEREQFIYDNELSLVCDQRYNEEDMNRIVEAINWFWKEV